MARKPSWLRSRIKHTAAHNRQVYADIQSVAIEKAEPILIVKGFYDGRFSTGMRPSHLDFNSSLSYLNAPPKNLEATIKARAGLGPNKDETKLKAIGNKFRLSVTADKMPRWSEQEELKPDLSMVRIGSYKNGVGKYREVGKPDAVPKLITVYKKKKPRRRK